MLEFGARGVIVTCIGSTGYVVYRGCIITDNFLSYTVPSVSLEIVDKLTTRSEKSMNIYIEPISKNNV